MCDLYELSAHGSRNIVNITDLYYNKVPIPSNFTFITFAPIGETLSQTFNDFYTFALHYYPNGLSKNEYDSLGSKPTRTINLEKDICNLTELSLEEDKIKIIDDIIVYGTISIFNHCKYENETKHNNLSKEERVNNILNLSYEIIPIVLNDLNIFLLINELNNYEDLIKNFMEKTMKDIIVIFMRYIIKKKINLDKKKYNYILQIIYIYIKLYQEKISDNLKPLELEITNLQDEYNKLNSKYNNPKDKDDKNRLLQNLNTIKDEINKIKNDSLFEIYNRLKEYILDEYLLSNIDNKILKKAINNFIEKTDTFIIKNKINLSDKFLNFVKMSKPFNLKINVYKKTVPKFDFSFYTTYTSKTVFYNGLLKTSESYPFDMLKFSKKRSDKNIPKNELINMSFKYNILSFISEKYDPNEKFDKRTLNISLEEVIRGLEQTSLIDDICTIVISACNVVYRNNQLVSNSELINEVNTELKNNHTQFPDVYGKILKEL